MRYLSLDIETLGLNRACSVLEVAFVTEDTEHPEIPVEDLPVYRVLFKPDLFVAEPYALDLHLRNGLWQESQADGVPPARAWGMIEQFLAQWKIRHGSKPFIAGKNVASFDLQFFPSEVRAYVQHRTIDPGSLFMTHAGVPSLAEIMERCGLPADDSHTAVADARNVIRVIRASKILDLGVPTDQP